VVIIINFHKKNVAPQSATHAGTSQLEIFWEDRANYGEVNLLAAWPIGLSRRFYRDCVITIGWSKFNFHPRRARFCVFG